MRVERTIPVGVYWEIYGVPPDGEALAYTLTVTRERNIVVPSCGGEAGRRRRRAPVYMQWDEPPSHAMQSRSRAISVDFSTFRRGGTVSTNADYGRPGNSDGESDGGVK
jgi:hypothetical protein